MNDLVPFDAADYPDSEKVVAEHLNAALEHSNPDVFLGALLAVAKVHGMAKLAQDTGLSRESLYKALKPGVKARYDTVRRVLHALGVTFQVLPTVSLEAGRQYRGGKKKLNQGKLQ